MTIRQQTLSGDVWLVTVTGRLDQSETPILEAALCALLEEDHTRLILDLSELSYVNSGGLRCMVTVWRQARKQGGELVLCSLGPRISEVINIVGFDKVFQIYSSRDEAHHALSQG